MSTDVVYVFPGQGSQYVGMGKELYEAFPAAKEIFDKANEILKFDLTKLCFEGPKAELTVTSNCSVAIATHSIAALRVFEETMSQDSSSAVRQSVTPDTGEGLNASPLRYTPRFALGLSLGEYSALIASGCLTFEDGLRLVRKRGEFMDKAAEKNPGKMVSILGMTLEQVEELIKGIGDCEIANLNCPGQIVISGKTANIELLAGLAKSKGAKRAIILDVSGAFHSSLMLPAKEKLEKEVEKVNFSTPQYPIISSIKAMPTDNPDEIKQNLVNQVNSRTLFESSIRYASGQGVKTYIEIGPGNVLRGLIRKIDNSLHVLNIEKPEHITAVTQNTVPQ